MIKGYKFNPSKGEILSQNDEVLAIVPHAIASDKYDLENGYLFASSPLLLFACRQCLAFLEQGVNSPEELISLLEKVIADASFKEMG